MAEDGADVSPDRPRAPNSGHWTGPVIRRIPGLVAANSILERQKLARAQKQAPEQSATREPKLPQVRKQGQRLAREMHTPQRPMWLCRACGHPWPCGNARLRLRHEYAHDTVSLRIYLASRMVEAIDDLLTLDPHGAPTAEAFFARFLAWAAPSTPKSSPRTPGSSARPEAEPP